MKRLIFLALIFAGCSEPPSAPIVPPDPLAEYYYVTAYPAWPACELDATYAGPEYTITPDSLVRFSPPVREAWSVEYRSDGAELWFTTPKGEHRFRGAITANAITGKMIHKSTNGRYGAIHPITFERVQP